MTERNRKCVFAGTFDPPTLGHKAIVESCLGMFDEVVLCMMVNPQKKPLFTEEERRDMLALTFLGEPRITVKSFSGTVAEFLQQENTRYYVRGLRSATDFDYENANFYATKKLDKNVVAVYLPCPQELLHVSSSMVRSSLAFGTPIDEYVSEEVKEYIMKRTSKQDA